MKKVKQIGEPEAPAIVEKQFSHTCRIERIKCTNANIYWIAITPCIITNITKYNETEKENKFITHVSISFSWILFSFKIYFKFIKNKNLK